MSYWCVTTGNDVLQPGLHLNFQLSTSLLYLRVIKLCNKQRQKDLRPISVFKNSVSRTTHFTFFSLSRTHFISDIFAKSKYFSLYFMQKKVHYTFRMQCGDYVAEINVEISRIHASISTSTLKLKFRFHYQKWLGENNVYKSDLWIILVGNKLKFILLNVRLRLWTINLTIFLYAGYAIAG